MFTATARDASGADVALGQGTVELRSGATTTLTITLGDMLPPPPDFGVVPADMMVPNAPVVTPATATVPRLGTQDFTRLGAGDLERRRGRAAAASTPRATIRRPESSAPTTCRRRSSRIRTSRPPSPSPWCSRKIDVIAGAPGGQGAVDGTGTNARFGGGEGMLAIDGAGNIYLPDRSNQTLRLITPAGVVTTIMGQVGRTPPAPDVNSQLLNDPLAVAVNGAGTTVYVSECSNHTVASIKYDSVAHTWTRKVIAGQPGVAGHADGSTGLNALLNCPTGLALDEANGALYVAEFAEHDIRKISLSGTFAITTVVGVPGTCGSQDSDSANDPPTFCNPYGLASDGSVSVGSTTLFVADSNNATVRKVVIANPLTGTTTIAGAAGVRTIDATHLARPMAVAYQNSSSLFVTDQSSSGAGGQMVRQIPLPAGGTMTTIAGTAGTAGYKDGAGNVALFNQLSGLALVGSTAYVWDDANFVVRTVGLTGAFTVATLAGSAAQYGTALQNGTGTASRFNQPVSLATDTSGAAYVADHANCAVRKIVVAQSGGNYSATVSTRGRRRRRRQNLRRDERRRRDRALRAATVAQLRRAAHALRRREFGALDRSVVSDGDGGDDLRNADGGARRRARHERRLLRQPRRPDHQPLRSRHRRARAAVGATERRGRQRRLRRDGGLLVTGGAAPRSRAWLRLRERLEQPHAAAHRSRRRLRLDGGRQRRRHRHLRGRPRHRGQARQHRWAGLLAGRAHRVRRYRRPRGARLRPGQHAGDDARRHARRAGHQERARCPAA